MSSFLLATQKKEFLLNFMGVANMQLFLPDFESYLFREGLNPLGLSLDTLSKSTFSNVKFLSSSLLILSQQSRTIAFYKNCFDSQLTKKRGISSLFSLIRSTNSFSSLAGQGVSPVNISQNIIPSAKISLRQEYLLIYSAQGGMQKGVPTYNFSSTQSFLQQQENPKSPIFHWLPNLMILAGFKSRWMMFLLIIYRYPFNICFIISMALSSVIYFCNLISQLRSPCGQYSVTRKQLTWVLQTSTQRITLPWLSDRMTSISVSSSNRQFYQYFDRSITLMANFSFRLARRVALYTLLLNPSPRKSLLLYWYLPIVYLWTSWPFSRDSVTSSQGQVGKLVYWVEGGLRVYQIMGGIGYNVVEYLNYQINIIASIISYKCPYNYCQRPQARTTSQPPTNISFQRAQQARFFEPTKKAPLRGAQVQCLTLFIHKFEQLQHWGCNYRQL